jgi:hypothetical protein
MKYIYTDIVPLIPEKEFIRFWAFVIKSDCWIWYGDRTKQGYGTYSVKVNGKWQTIGVHRISYELYYGSISDGLFVCHHCDNPPCLNPEHLFLGTAKDNVQDMLHKGRGKHQKALLMWSGRHYSRV